MVVVGVAKGDLLCCLRVCRRVSYHTLLVRVAC
jgi:hypothetical protein